MARALKDKQNVQAPNYFYPYGRIKDNPGNGTGTPVNEQVYGDFHQFFAKLLADASITANGLPENDLDGYQYINALKNLVQSMYNAAFINTGIAYSAGYSSDNSPNQFLYRLVGNTVTLKGNIALDLGIGGNPIKVGVVIATLPVAIRPNRQISRMVTFGSPQASAAAGYFVMTIDTNGQIKFYQGSRADGDDADINFAPTDFSYEKT